MQNRYILLFLKLFCWYLVAYVSCIYVIYTISDVTFSIKLKIIEQSEFGDCYV